MAQSGDSEYFPETGHYITGDFYDFYFSNPNARLVYGRPITEAFLDPDLGLMVQYFENVRFEFHPTLAPAERVQVTALGLMMYERGEFLRELNGATPNCYQSEAWSFPVCFEFLEFYSENGGQAQFGKPVSTIELLHGRLVQFFEHAQFIWMPDNPNGARVTLAPLGLKYFERVEADSSKTNPIRNFQYNLSISEIEVKAFTKLAVVSNDANQSVNIIVVDQNGAPLTGGIVSVALQYENGQIVYFKNVATDQYGLARVGFTINSEQIGVVNVIVKVLYNDLEASTVTSFRIWY